MVPVPPRKSPPRVPPKFLQGNLPVSYWIKRTDAGNPSSLRSWVCRKLQVWKSRGLALPGRWSGRWRVLRLKKCRDGWMYRSIRCGMWRPADLGLQLLLRMRSVEIVLWRGARNLCGWVHGEMISVILEWVCVHLVQHMSVRRDKHILVRTRIWQHYSG